MACPGERFSSRVHDDALNAAEQCFYCLYHYPTKKKRHLQVLSSSTNPSLGRYLAQDHSAHAITLTWERAFALFDFLVPSGDEEPAFDGYSNDTLNADAIAMLRRIERLVPGHLLLHCAP